MRASVTWRVSKNVVSARAHLRKTEVVYEILDKNCKNEALTETTGKS
jgi:hypothetical protein